MTSLGITKTKGFIMTVKDLKNMLDEMPENNEIIFIGLPLPKDDLEIVENPDANLKDIYDVGYPENVGIADREGLSALFYS
jgi:hypothetical protein